MRRLLIASLFLIFSSLLLAQPPANDPLLKMGYASVLHFGADNTGNAICTAQVQAALDWAQDNRYVTYFPAGTYLIDNTLKCMLVTESFPVDRRKPHVLMGDPAGEVIIKVTGSNFNDKSNPKPVFWFWGQPQKGVNAWSTNPLHEQDNVNFNQSIRGFTIDLNKKPGACAIRHFGAQGSTIEDIHIIATGAFSGLYNACGQGGGNFNITVDGGDYGVYIETGKFLSFTGCEFKNQTKNAIYIKKNGPPMVFSGLKIMNSGQTPFAGVIPEAGLSIIDADISGSGTQVFNLSDRSSIYLSNVYVKGYNEIAFGKTIANKDTWTRFKEYNHWNNGSLNVEDGTTISGDLPTQLETNTPPPTDHITRHLWNVNTFPSIAMAARADYVNIKDPSKMGSNVAQGNGTSDDTAALEYAINNFTYVFIPKGKYRVSKSIELKANTKMFGTGRKFSVILPLDSWKPSYPTHIITTVNAANGSAVFSDIGTDFDQKNSGNFGLIAWKIGRNSIVRDVGGECYNAWSTRPIPTAPSSLIQITGSGGGKWYGVAPNEGTFKFVSVGAGFRSILIEGTTQPLNFYQMNVERVFQYPQGEIRNAKNVNLYYFKSESGDTGNVPSQFVEAYLDATSLMVSQHSENIRIHGYSGNMDLNDDKGVLEIEDATNILVSSLHSWQPASGYKHLIERISSTIEVEVPSSKSVSVFKRGVSNTALAVQEIPELETGFVRYDPELKAVDFLIYPQQAALLDVEIYDTLGRKIHETTFEMNSADSYKNQIDFNRASGVYIVLMKYAQYTFSQKILVIH